MRMPRVEELYRPILEFLPERDEGRTVGEITDYLEGFFYLKEDGQEEASGNAGTGFGDRAYQACADLVRASLAIEIEEDTCAISNLGKDVLDNIDIIDGSTLAAIPPYQPPATVMARVQHLTADGRVAEKEEPMQTGEAQYWDATADQFMECPQRAEYLYPISFSDIAGAADTDTRLANMMSTGDYVFSDGTLMTVTDCLDGKAGADSGIRLCSNGDKTVMATPEMMKPESGKRQTGKMNADRETGRREGNAQGDAGTEKKPRKRKEGYHNESKKEEKIPDYEKGMFHVFPWRQLSAVEYHYIVHEWWKENFPESFGHSLPFLMFELDMGSRELGYIIDMSYKNIEHFYKEWKHKNGEWSLTEPSFECVAGICFAMRLPYRYSKNLIRSAGFDIESEKPIIRACRPVLETGMLWTYKEMQDELTKMGAEGILSWKVCREPPEAADKKSGNAEKPEV